MRFSLDQGIKLFDPPAYHHPHSQFELEFDLNLNKENNNIIYVGEEDTFIIIDSLDNVLHAS